MATQNISHTELTVHDRFFELYDRMIGDVNIPDVLAHVTEVARKVLNAERATTYLVLEETQELESVAVIGSVSRTIRVPIRESSLSGYCALSRRAFCVPDAYGDLSVIDEKLRFDHSWDTANNFCTRDVMCAPAVFRDRILGVVQVINKNGDGTFTADDLPPLQSVSRLIAYALYHAQLYDEIATLKNLRKKKAEFMRIMVHELKSPVAASRMLLTLLADEAGENEKVAAFTERIGKRMDSMIGLVEDILEFSRVSSGTPLGQVSVFDLCEETENGCKEYREQALAKGLGMSVDVPDEPLQIRFDIQGCKLLLSNLISNAVKYTGSGSVKVSLCKEGDQAVLRVKDSGIGIPKEEIPKMFTEFFRASNAKKSKIQGTGVGLAGVKELVERFGGTMEMDSELNVGSTFTVRLPLYKE